MSTPAQAARTTGTAAGLAAAAVVVGAKIAGHFHLDIDADTIVASTTILTYVLGRAMHLPSEPPDAQSPPTPTNPT